MNSVNYTLQVLSRVILNKKFSFKVHKVPLYNDEPKIYAYVVEYKLRKKYKTATAAGFSFDKRKALIRALAEGLERYCLDNSKPEILFTGSEENLSMPHLDPLKITSFSKKQLQKSPFRRFRYDKTSRFKWIKGFSLMRKKEILLPAQLVYFNYRRMIEEPIISLPLSTGAAAGLSLNDALYRGICEITERDAFLISYLNKLPSPQINLSSLKDQRINEILDIFQRYKLELIVIDLTMDLQIPVFTALTLDRTGQGPAISIGLKAGFNIRESIIGAIEESLMGRSWIRDKFIYTEPNHKGDKTIRTIEDRAHFWFPLEALDCLDFWIKSSNKRVNMKFLRRHAEGVQLEKIIALLKNKQVDIIYVDITDSEMKEYGISVVKVLIPELQPLYLDERYPYWGGRRLYEVPVSMGFLKTPTKETELNKIPHPFL